MNNELKDGAAAFPEISLRDFFAGQALIGYLSQDYTSFFRKIAKEKNIKPIDVISQACYEHADAMIKERGEK